MIPIAATLAICVLATSPSAFAWGANGHQIVGLIAEHFLSIQAKAYIDNVLKPTESISSVTTWPDKVKRGPIYGYSSSYHYADANDNPPTSCGYDDDRDCKSGDCLVRAVANYTSQAMCSSHSPFSTHTELRYEAVKFITHFVGDITQPLHTSARDRGGNEAKAMFAGHHTNLHSIWDTWMPNKRITEDFNDSLQSYADYLANHITHGMYHNAVSTWISHHSLVDLNHNNNSRAAIAWTRDSNAYDCSVVWPGYDANPSQDFSGSYYTMAVPIIDLQLAKGGLRLADWINRIAATC